MKRKFLLVCSVCVFVLCCTSMARVSAQTGIRIINNDDTETVYSVREEGKLYFEKENLVIYESLLFSAEIPVSNIKKIVIAQNQVSIGQPVPGNSSIICYPNPAQNFIRIAAPGAERLTVKIYSLSGQKLLEGKYNTEESIDISSLSPGFYLVRINETTLKLSKI